MKQKIIFRADGNSSIGLGHLLRLIALAEMLKADFFISFAIQNPTPYSKELIKTCAAELIELPIESNFIKEAEQHFAQHLKGNEIIVIDGYSFGSEYQKILKSKCKKLVFIDDLHSWHQYADVIINHAAHVNSKDYDAETNTQFYLGLNYALLRPEFLQNNPAKRNVPELNKIIVSMGGADIFNVSLKIVEALSTLEDLENITLLVGKVNPHFQSLENYITENKLSKFQIKSNLSATELVHELNSSQLVICPASTTAIEACAVGIGMLSGYTASNQLDILNGLELNNCLINLGDLTQIPIQQIRVAVLDLIENTTPLVKMMIAQKELIDGKSPERFLKLFSDLI